MYEIYSTELAHHGILGQRWGVRRFQNSDGSLTSEGSKRYKLKEGHKLTKVEAAYDNGYRNGKKHERIAANTGAVIGAGLSLAKSAKKGRSKTSTILAAIGSATLGSVAATTGKAFCDIFLRKGDEFGYLRGEIDGK